MGIQENNDANFSVSAVYPNPSHGQINLNVHVNHSSTFNCAIINCLGKAIGFYSFTLEAGNNQLNISNNNLPAGVYFVDGTIGNHRFTQKFILVK